MAKGKMQWLPVENDYLFNQEALSRVFRAKFMERLGRARKTGTFKFSGQAYGDFKNMLYAKNWVVSVRDPVKRTEQVLGYLARYTHRVAIANSRIKKLENGMVSFTVKNRKKQRTETITITAVEFIKRFLLHSLPKGFVRIRQYGFLANRDRNENINVIRHLMGVSALPEKQVASIEQLMLQLTGTDITTCPCCSKGRMYFFAEIPKGRARAPSHLAGSVG